MAPRNAVRKGRKASLASAPTAADLKSFFTSPSTTAPPSVESSSPIPRSIPAVSPASTIEADSFIVDGTLAFDCKPPATKVDDDTDETMNRINDPAREADPPPAQPVSPTDAEFDRVFATMDLDKFTTGTAQQQMEASKNLDETIGHLIAANKEGLNKISELGEELTGLSARESKMIRDIDGAIKNGRLDPRSSLGQKFAEEHKPGKPGHEERNICVITQHTSYRQTNTKSS